VTEIHGIMITKNNWGIAPIAICYALKNHVNTLHILDHGSSDEARTTLCALKNVWGEKLKVYTLSPDAPFQQSLFTNILVTACEKYGADWIYVIDDDEFLLPKSEITLKDELNALSEDVVSLRYEVRNFIAPKSFDVFCLDDYATVKHMAKPLVEKLLKSPYDSIYHGDKSFFDIPFPSKIIFRANKNLWVNAGSHSLKSPMSNNKELKHYGFFCGHLTFPGRDSLNNKVNHGKELLMQGFNRNHGWQSQLLFQLDKEKRLDEFWENHSINDSNDLKDKHIFNESLSSHLFDTITFLKDLFNTNNLSNKVCPNDLSFKIKEEHFDFNMIFNFIQRISGKS